MATKQTTVREPSTGQDIMTIRPNTPEMERYLSAGYDGMTLEEAQVIVQEWAADHKSWPLPDVRKARAFIAAYSATPEPVSDKPAWRLTPHPPRTPRRRA